MLPLRRGMGRKSARVGAVLILAVLVAVTVIWERDQGPAVQSRPALAQEADFDVAGGHFYTQAGGGSALGFAVVDDASARFWTEFERLGGWQVLGYPISHRFEWDGFLVQATQRVVMQWRPELGQVVFVNVFDRLHDLGFDPFLLTSRQTPPPLDTSSDAGKTFAQVARERSALLEQDQAIKDAYMGVPGGDPLQMNGLPTSPVTDMGNHFALRAQRVVIQHWKEDVPWARAGEVTFALGGDIAKEVGALPDEGALVPAAAPGSSAPSPVAIPRTATGDRIGVTFSANDGDRRAEPAMELLGPRVGAGAGWVRINVAWAVVEPEPGRFDWSSYDTAIARARAEGYEVLVLLAYSTRWSSSAPADVTRAGERVMYPPGDLAAWDRYVSAAVSRYKADVHYWEVWNEPDLRGFWRGTPAQYAELLDRTYQVVKGTDSGAQVLFAGLALSGGGDVWNKDFFPAVLNDPAHPGARSFDIANFHHYGPKNAARQRMNAVRSELTRVGAGSRPIWITESGYASDPTFQQESAYQGGEGQAQWLRDMMPFLLDELGADRVFWFTLWDDSRGGRIFSTHGLLDANLAPKPAYTALRDFISSR